MHEVLISAAGMVSCLQCMASPCQSLKNHLMFVSQRGGSSAARFPLSHCAQLFDCCTMVLKTLESGRKVEVDSDCSQSNATRATLEVAVDDCC